ncbi:MAG: helix-turn-helix domain-containing protein [Prevotellaceae bacterium]|jgi:transcriptional antiterminator|nr:helix-turn-helix domain-containing protein [Prevotellaceae bacterium]
MKKEIVVKVGMVQEIAKALDVTERTVYNALRYITNGKKSAAVRQLAKEKMKDYGSPSNTDQNPIKA